jgi:pyruvate dehydrogenase E2 component (dihydrolipoamide acetyltransferase)
MSAPIIILQLAERVTEGKILTWFKSVGDEVMESDNLFEVETDKVALEVQSSVAGRLTQICAGTGIIARIGDVVAFVGEQATSGQADKVLEHEKVKTSALRSPL